jgi:hypothetical protein
VSSIDQFEHDDAAYVLGALSDPDRDAFEAHLATCAACATRVNALAATSTLLADITADDLAEPDPAPDTLLPGLLRRAGSARRRQRQLVTGLSLLAAACLTALAVAVWPTSHTANGPAPQAMSALTASPVQATAAVTDRKWGTQIDLACHYAGYGDPSTYGLQIVDRAGATHDLGTWTLQPRIDTTFISGTALHRDQISSIEITRPDGTPILQLTT